MKFRKGDQVILTVGKDAGKKGKIEEVYPKENTVLLPGLNMYKRHMKRRDDKTPGGIIDRARPVKATNIALICPKCNKQTKIGMKIEGDTKMRMCRKCEATL